MIVMKFGGSSLATREQLSAAAQIVAGETGPQLVVVSAIGDTTDRLIAAGQMAESGDAAGARAQISRLLSKHRELTDEPAVHATLDRHEPELLRLIEGVSLLGEQTARSRALLASFGERLSAPLIVAELCQLSCNAEVFDAREFIVTDERHDDAQVLLKETRDKVGQALKSALKAGQVPVVTGYIAATREGTTTLLGRNGSDYTATLLASLLGAEQILIWTDVDGILTADPRLVADARVLDQVSYREAAEMSYFGAPVMHPSSMLPAMQGGIPIRVRNTRYPRRPGTLITEDSPIARHGVKTVTTIDGLSLVSIDGRGMAGIPGVAKRVFEASEACSANVVMISQGSSEQTISVVVRQEKASALVRALDRSFSAELSSKAIESIRAEPDVSVVTVIGRGMAGTPGTAARFFEALAAVRVNVRAIAQGASELSISAAIRSADAVRTVRAAHTTFGLNRVTQILLLGCGRVGKTFLEQLEQTRETLPRSLGLELQLVGVCDSKRLLFDPRGLQPSTASDALSSAAPRPPDDALIEKLIAQHFTNVTLVDVTAADTGQLHRRALSEGINVVTANKRPLSESLELHRQILDCRSQSGARYEYETTFGAGLPVLHTLQELLHTGDRLLSIKGCLSGTLGFLCTRLQDGCPLAQAVQEAAEAGYTEPDPCEDLSGRDVARKAIIIARAAGIPLGQTDVELQPLVPGLEAGLEAAVADFEPQLSKRLADAARQGRTLRYTAEITPQSARVGLSAVPLDGPIGALRGPDNILVFKTGRYDDYPLVIQGPGAGAEVTAAGVLGDAIKAARR